MKPTWILVLVLSLFLIFSYFVVTLDVEKYWAAKNHSPAVIVANVNGGYDVLWLGGYDINFLEYVLVKTKHGDTRIELYPIPSHTWIPCRDWTGITVYVYNKSTRELVQIYNQTN